MSVEPNPSTPRGGDALVVTTRERRARTALAIAALITVAGLGVAGTLDRTSGGVITVAGWVVLVGALHALGRAAAPPAV